MKKLLNNIAWMTSLFNTAKLLLLTLALSAGFGHTAYAQTTVTLTATADAGFWNNNATEELKNFGVCNILYLNGPSGTAKDRSVIRYDLSSIPANATITSATVRLIKIGGATTARNMSIHRVTADWTEGTQSCTGAAGVCNWQQRMTGINWTTPGGDFDATATATLSVAANATYDFSATSLVQGWVSGTYSNYGIMFKFTTENLNSEVQFGASENTTAGNRPQLVVTYTVPTLSTSITNVTSGSNGAIDLTVTGGTSPYTYLWSNSATTQDLSGLAAGTYTVTVTDNLGATATASATVSSILSITDGMNASDLIGQYTTTAGFTNNYTQATANNNNGSVYALGLNVPEQFVIDKVNHRAFVSEAGNNRVLVFNLNASNNLVDKTPDFVLGQASFTTNTAATTQNGMRAPVGVTYDATNNRLFVADRNNHRILVFDVSTITNGENAVAVLGQTNFTTGTSGLSQSKFNSLDQTVYDAATNRLFVADRNNHRILVFDVTSITNGQNAINVLGQGNYTTGTAAVTATGLSGPSGLAYDASQNRLFVANWVGNRVMVYDVASITNGEAAINVLGQSTFTTSTAATTQTGMSNPYGLFYDDVNDRLFVAENGNNRITVFDANTITNGEAAINVLGQSNFTTGTTAITQSGLNSPENIFYNTDNGKLYVPEYGNNRVTIFNAQPQLVLSTAVTNATCGSNGAITLSVTGGISPYTYNWGGGITTQNRSNLAASTYNVTVTDALGTTATTSATVSLVPPITNGMNAADLLGQYTTTAGFSNNYTQATANNNNGSVYALGFSGPTDIEMDAVNHRLFVVDGTNNRVLIYNLDASNNLVDKTPDFVLGQPNFTSNTAAVTATGMDAPRITLYDPNTNRLFVSEQGNNRVLVFDVATITNGEAAVNVLGQPNFTSNAGGANQTTMSWAYGLAMNPATNQLFVSEIVNHRILVFDVTTITNGEPAVNVLGQPDFTTVASAVSQSGFFQLRNLRYANNLLYVSDAGNNRVMVFDVTTITNGEPAINVLGQANFTSNTAATTQSGLSQPREIVYDGQRIFVSDLSNNRVLVYDVTTITNGENAVNVLGQSNFTTSTAAVTQTGMNFPAGLHYDTNNGSLYVADNGNNRVLVFSGQPILTTSITNAICGNNGAIDLTVTGGTIPYTYTWSNGATTQDLSTLAAGSYTVTVTDACGKTATTSAVIMLQQGPGGVCSNLLQWLRADSTGVVGGGGTPVNVWQDKSSAARNATQVTVANQPILTSNVMNFNPGVVFDGINDNMTYSDVGMVSGAGARATFVVAGLSATDANNRSIWNYGTVVQFQLYGFRKSNTGDYQVDGVNANNTIPSLFNSTDKYILYGGYTGTQVQGAYNGSSIGGNAFTWNTTLSGTGTLGSKLGNLEYWQGPIAEVIHYSGNLSATDINKINSYLAIKYGITLDQTTPTNYVASDGTVFFSSGINNFLNNNAGIARDDASGLNQKQSRSANPGLQVTIGNGNTIAAYNAANPNNFTTDKSALMWGNNTGLGDAWNATGAPAGYQRLNRTWRVVETGTVGSVKVQIPDNSGTDGLPAETTTVSLLVKSDNDFSTGATIIPMTLVGTNWEANVDFTNLQYFTFATFIPLTVQNSITNVSCFGGSNGIINLTPTGGIAPYTYLWNGGQTTQNRTGLAAGSYTVTVSDNGGNSLVLNLTVTQPAAVTATGVVTAVTCTTGGAINLTASGGTAPYTYDWADIAGTNNPEDRSGLVGGNYSVTVTDAKGCTATNTFNLATPTCLPNTTVCKSNAADVFSVTPDPMVNTYTWTVTGGGVIVSGQGTPSVTVNWTGATVGTGSVCCKTVNSCGESANICKDVYIREPIAGAAVISPVCVGSNILLSGSGGVSYQWSGPSGFTANSEAPIINNATLANAGTYNVTVTDASGCSATSMVAVTVSTPPTATTVVTTATCGASNGAVALTPASGTSPYTYLWSNGATTQNLSSLSAASYTVTVTDNNGCKAVTTANVGNTSAQTVTLTPTNVACFGGSTGQIVSSVSGGTAPFTYFWSTGATTANLTGLGLGGYSVTVTGADGCDAVASATLIQPNELAIDKAITNVNCIGGTTGAINLTVTGGTTPYTYNWGGGVTTEDRTGLAAGVYNVTVTDANNCSLTTVAVVTQPASPLIAATTVTNITCNGAANGLINLTASGGTLPYTYLWTGGATTEDISNKAAGTYSVTVTDAKGCTATSSKTITEPAVLSLTNARTNVSCNGGTTGAINLTATGGNAPLSYAWSNGATTEDLTTIGAGTYGVTVTDAKACTATASITVTQPATLTATATPTNPSCSGGSNGSIAVTITGGTTAYTYLWSNGATTQNLTNIAAGTYTLTVTDTNNCTTVVQATLTNPTAMSLTGTVTDVACFGVSTGAISITTTNGVGALTYNWGGGITSQNRTAIAAGTYTVTVTDANTCTATRSFVVAQPAAALMATPTKTDVACNGNADGSINLTVTGGSAPYTFSWSNSATTQNISSLMAGTYTVTVTDANNCTTTSSVTIAQPAATILSATTTSAACNGANDGAIDLTVTGSAGPYTYNWSNGATTEDISSITGGNYNVTVTTATGCPITLLNITVNEIGTIAITPTVTHNLCASGNQGAISLTVTGGTAPLSYAWSNGATTKDISNLTAGTYTVVIRDDANCVKFYTFVITQPTTLTPLVLSAVTTQPNCGASTGVIDLTATGGLAPYSYAWSNSATTQDLSSIAAGIYRVSVTDANGCIQNYTSSVNSTEALILTPTVNSVSCKGGTNGSITTTISGGTAPYTYSWSNSTTAASLTGVAAGTYSVVVTDASGCRASTSQTVTEPTVALSVITNINAPNCIGTGGEAFASPSGGTTPYTYAWSNSATTSSISNLSPATYTVTVTDFKGCTAIGTSTIVAANCLPPVAVNDNFTTPLNTPITQTVAPNDSDPDGLVADLVFSLLTNPTPAQGVIDFDGTYGNFTFTPATGFTGTVTLNYQVCDLTNLCTTGTLTITVSASILPVTESGTSPSTGGTPIANVRSNDTVNGFVATGSNSTISQSGVWPSGITLNTTTGAITVAPGTTPAVYPVTYQLCDLATPTPNCATVVDNITVTPVINPVTESGTIPSTGGTPIVNVRSNDFVNGIAATSGNSTISQSGVWPSGITLNTTTGAITVASGTTPAVYPVTYQLCDLATPTANCATVVDNITVTPVINPVTESGSVTSAAGGTAIANVRTNDLVNGLAATSGNSTISQSGVWPSGISLNTTTGAINVVAGTLPAVYPVTYQLCDLATPTANCATVVDNITVSGSINPVTESGSVRSLTGGIAIANVRTNDLVNGVAATSSNSTISQSGVWPSGITLNTTTGAIIVTPGTAAAVYPLTYQLCDLATPTPNCATVVDNITVINNPPIAVNDIAVTPQDKPVVGNVLTNDDDPDSDPITAITTPISNPTKGTVVLNPNGVFTYTPNAGQTGEDKFCYAITDGALKDTACVTINIIPNPIIGNDKPVANDDATQTPMNTNVSINVKSNDTDPDGNGTLGIPTPLSTTTVKGGTMTNNNDGTFTYTPPTGFIGKDSVQYRICDNGSPSLCDTAWVIIEVITTPAVGNQPPVALDDAGLTHPGTLVTITVKGNDFDPDGGVLGSPSVVTPPTNGTIVINGDGTVTYTPTSPTFVGSDVFTYKICDNGSPSLCDTATVTIGILPANNPPIAVNDIAVTPQDKPVVGNVMTNDDDPDSDPITAVTTLMSNPMKGTVVLNTNGVFTYTPNTGQTGEDKFCYTITDGALKDTACVTINIIPNPIIGNDKPVANDDATQTPMNTNVSINVKSNDTDPDGNGTLGIPSPLSTTTVKGGTMTNNNDGTFTYSPPTGFIGKDSVQYRICDNGSPSLCDTAWVTIEVIPTPAVGNQPPVAMDDAALTNMGTPVTIAIKTNDFDPDGGILGTPAVVTSPTNGSVVVNPDGTVTYTPTSPTFVGSDVFTYKICDNGSPSKCDTATVTIGILPPLPAVTVVANMDIAGTIAGTLVNIPILTNDTDNGAGATLSNVTTPTITRNPTKGTASIKPDGTIDYTPNAAANGSDTLIYQICDQISTTTCDTALVVINIGIRLLPRAYLLGCYNETTSLMHDSLRRKNLIPLQQPYNQTEYSDNTYTGTETVTPSVLTTVGNNAIVDWVLVELRSPTDPKNILFRRAALIQRDGDIVDVDGVSPVMFGSTSPASYYVSVKHRNHLGVLTALAQPLTFVPLVVDFTLTTTDNYKTTSLDKDFAQKPTANNKRAMWMGNINKDNMVIFQGPNNDVGQLYLNVLTDSNNGGFLANYILNGYLRGDVDMDGLTIYQGPGNEVDKVFFEVVLHPINTTYLYNFIINEQIPK